MRMNQEIFWSLIEQIAPFAEEYDKESLVMGKMDQLTVEERAEFSRILMENMEELKREELFHALKGLDPNLSENGFKRYRVGIIAKGQTTYETVLENAECIKEVFPRGQMEGLSHANCLTMLEDYGE